MILLFTNLLADPTLVRLQAVLDQRGVAAVVLSPETMAEQSVSLYIQADGQAILRLGEQTVKLQDIRSAWLWRSWYGSSNAFRLEQLVASPEDRTFVQREWLAFDKGLTTALQY